jgi:hypothetical protein
MLMLSGLAQASWIRSSRWIGYRRQPAAPAVHSKRKLQNFI